MQSPRMMRTGLPFQVVRQITTTPCVPCGGCSEKPKWTIIKASPKIKTHAGARTGARHDADIEAKLLPFCKQPLRDVLMIMRDSGMRTRRKFFECDGAPGLGQQTIFRLRDKSPKGRRFVPISPRVRQALLARYSEQKRDGSFPQTRPRWASDNGRQTVRESQKGGRVCQ